MASSKTVASSIIFNLVDELKLLCRDGILRRRCSRVRCFLLSGSDQLEYLSYFRFSMLNEQKNIQPQLNVLQNKGHGAKNVTMSDFLLKRGLFAEKPESKHKNINRIFSS